MKDELEKTKREKAEAVKEPEIIIENKKHVRLKPQVENEDSLDETQIIDCSQFTIQGRYYI